MSTLIPARLTPEALSLPLAHPGFIPGDPRLQSWEEGVTGREVGLGFTPDHDRFLLVKVTRTAKLKLNCSPEQAAALRAVTSAYRDAQNLCSRWAFANNKTSSNTAIHRACYADIRAKHGLSSQLACTAERTVAATYKTLWTTAKLSAARRQSALVRKAAGGTGRLPRLYMGLEAPPVFRALTLEYQYGRDWSLKKDQTVSVMTLGGRISLKYEGWNRHLDDLRDEATDIGAAKLWYQKAKKQWYLLVAYTIELPDFKATDFKQVVGVDVGQRYHAVTKAIDLDDSPPATLYGSQVHRRQADHYQHLRTKLQAKGTRGSKRRLQAVSTRERRFTADRNHVLARQIIDAHPLALIGMEELAHIRDRTERWSTKTASVKQKRANRVRSTWSYAEMRAFVTYKAPLAGSLVIAVDPAYTSQTCPRCAHVSRENRVNGGEVFDCVSCGYQGHADVVGATNVGMRAWRVKEEGRIPGCLSATPSLSDQVEDVTHGEAEGQGHLTAEAECSHKPATSVVGG